MTLPVLSLWVNVAVLVPVCSGLLLKSPRMDAVFGPWSPARGILLSLYLTIAVASAGLLLWPNLTLTGGLLAMQVVYKLITPVTVGTVRNPVVVSNMLIAALHVATLASLR